MYSACNIAYNIASNIAYNIECSSVCNIECAPAATYHHCDKQRDPQTPTAASIGADSELFHSPDDSGKAADSLSTQRRNRARVLEWH